MKRVFLLTVVFTITIFAQQSNLKTAFLTANLGVFSTSHSNFESVYDSKTAITPEIGFGLPLSTRMYIYGKATYFAKDGVPLISTYSYDTSGVWKKIGERKDGSSKFRQWIFNAGLQYNIFLSEEYTLGLAAGATVVNIYEHQQSMDNSVNSTSVGGGWLGYFGGMSIERNFEASPFSVIAEAQYNLSRNDIKAFIGNYGGYNFNLGVRYYFKERRRQ